MVCGKLGEVDSRLLRTGRFGGGGVVSINMSWIDLKSSWKIYLKAEVVGFVARVGFVWGLCGFGWSVDWSRSVVSGTRIEGEGDG